MIIYLAGWVSGNLTAYFRALSVFIEQGYRLKEAKEKAMRVFSRGGDPSLDTRRVFAH